MMAMTTLWCDTETTGIDPAHSGAFEIAFLVYRGAEMLDEKLYHLNPLNDEVLWNEEAFKVNGVSKETIRSYPPLEQIVPEIANFLEKYAPPEKMVFAGYCSGFDYGHLESLLFRGGGFFINIYCNGKMIDVHELVKKACEQGVLPETRDRKLTTMTKALGIMHEDAHTALSDIKATRRLYETLYFISRRKGK
jgi:DNA polymerase III epsilon subunit-like protein